MQPDLSEEMSLLAKIRQLPPERLIEVEDFVDFLSQRSDDSHLRLAAAKVSEASFAREWDNPDDAAYDSL